MAGGRSRFSTTDTSICVLAGAVWTFKHKQFDDALRTCLYSAFFIITFDVPQRDISRDLVYRSVPHCGKLRYAAPAGSAGLATSPKLRWNTVSWRKLHQTRSSNPRLLYRSLN